MGSAKTKKSARKLVPVKAYSRCIMFRQDPFGKVLFQKYGIGLHANVSAKRKVTHHITWTMPMTIAARWKVWVVKTRM